MGKPRNNNRATISCNDGIIFFFLYKMLLCCCRQTREVKINLWILLWQLPTWVYKSCLASTWAELSRSWLGKIKRIWGSFPAFALVYTHNPCMSQTKKNKGKVHLWLYRPQHPYTSRQVAFHFSWVWSKLMCLFISCSCRLDSTACREAESEPSVIMRCRLPERPSCTSSLMTSSSTRTAAAAASGVCTGPGGSPRTKR